MQGSIGLEAEEKEQGPGVLVAAEAVEASGYTVTDRRDPGIPPRFRV